MIATIDELWIHLEELSGHLIEKKSEELSLVADIHLDSLAFIILAASLAEHGGEIPDEDWDDIKTVGDVWFNYQFRVTNPAK